MVDYDFSDLDPEVVFRPGRGDCTFCNGYDPACYDNHKNPDDEEEANGEGN